MTLLTEKEAAEKWCPLTFNLSSSDMCVGSRCMAWRVKGKRHDESCETVVFARKASVPKCTCAPQAIGYCGAFGKVEP